jgi:hypothetical protein
VLRSEGLGWLSIANLPSNQRNNRVKTHITVFLVLVLLFAAWCAYVEYVDDIGTANLANRPRKITIDVLDLRSSLSESFGGERTLPWVDGETFVAIDDPTAVSINDGLRSEQFDCDFVTATLGDSGEIRLFFSAAPTDLEVAYADALRFSEFLEVDQSKFREWWSKKRFLAVDPSVNQNGRNRFSHSSIQIRSSLQESKPFRVIVEVHLTCNPQDIAEIRRSLKSD